MIIDRVSPTSVPRSLRHRVEMVDPALAEVTNGAKVMTHGMFKPGFSSLASADLDTGDYRGAQRIAEALAAAEDKFTRMDERAPPSRGGGALQKAGAGVRVTSIVASWSSSPLFLSRPRAGRLVEQSTSGEAPCQDAPVPPGLTRSRPLSLSWVRACRVGS